MTSTIRRSSFLVRGFIGAIAAVGMFDANITIDAGDGFTSPRYIARDGNLFTHRVDNSFSRVWEPDLVSDPVGQVRWASVMLEVKNAKPSRRCVPEFYC